MDAFPHERLEVYGLTIQAVDHVARIEDKLPRHRWFLADQLLRASTSVTLNLAEARGKQSPARGAAARPRPGPERSDK